MKSDLEIRVCIPDGYDLVGVRTEGDAAVLVTRPKASEIRQIGFTAELYADEDEDEDSPEVPCGK